MLRQCIQRAAPKGGGSSVTSRRRAYHSSSYSIYNRQSLWSATTSTTSSLLSNDNDDHKSSRCYTSSATTFDTRHATTTGVASPSTLKVITTGSSSSGSTSSKRYFSISRHPDNLTQHGTINTLDTEDDLIVPDGDGGKGGNNNDDNSDDIVTPLSEFWADELEEVSDTFGLGNKKGGAGTGGGKGRDVDYSSIFGGAVDGDNNDEFNNSNNDNDDDDEQTKADKEYALNQLAINNELDKRTGRLWTDDWIISDEEWMTDETYDDIEEWQVNKFTTRKALENVRVYNINNHVAAMPLGTKGVPNLKSLSKLQVPPTLPSHPGHGTPIKYATYRKRQLNRRLQSSIQIAIHDDLMSILKMTSWDDKQQAVDALYENILERMVQRERVLCQLPNFSSLVEESLEKVLLGVQSNLMKDGKKREREEKAATAEADDVADDEVVKKEESVHAATTVTVDASRKEETSDNKENLEAIIDVMDVNKETPTPIFMDILAAANSIKGGDTLQKGGDDTAATTAIPTISTFFTESNNDGVPNLLYPLNVHKNEGVGRMVEEWQLAAHKDTKRIMIRDVMVNIASKIVNAANCCDVNLEEETKNNEGGAVRVFVSGKRGVGKTAALAGIVASARTSGHIVVYHPDGDRLRKHGYYIDPCNHRPGLYNLPEIAKQFCDELLTSHGEDISALPFSASRDDMKEYLTDDQIRRVFKRAYADDESVSEEETAMMKELSLDKILTVGIGSTSLSSGCYCTVINRLMNQTEKPFTVVMDEFNCYYDHGHYFHMDYDEHIRKGVPPNRISIFKPFMDALGLYPDEAGTDMTNDLADDSKKALMKWGSIVVGTSESRAVKRSFTQALEKCAHEAQSEHDDDGLHVVEVRRFSDVEVQHQLYNYEITGVGKLRFDRGETTLNSEEVEYLRLVSGGSGQQLMDACMIPNS